MDARGLRALSVVLVVVCSIVVVAAPVGGAVDAGSRPAALQADGEDDLTLEDADRIGVDVFIAANGTALVTVDYQFHHYDENTSDRAWGRLQADIESDPEAYADAERTKWNDTIAAGANETGRNMTLSNLSVETENESAPREIGHVRVSFVWESFALVEINQIEAGPALTGLTLTDDMSLQFRWPEGYSVYESDGQPQIDPSPTDRADSSIIWQGDQTEFAADQPWIVLIEDGGSNATSTPSTEGPTMPWTIVVLALSLLAAVGVAGWLIGSQRTGDGSAAEPERAPQPDGASGSESNAADAPPPELLSNEERVLRLLEERGGRIKQQEVVSELGWTEAKTSQVVGDLREDGEIEVFRIGRENVLALPDEE